MKILITGSEGFIGKSLFKTLSKNHEVFGIDKEGTPSKHNIVWDLLETPTFYAKEYDKFVELENKIDLVIHCAANVGVDFCLNNKNTLLENLKIDERIFHFAQDKKIIYFSTSEVYGDGRYSFYVGQDCSIPETQRANYALEKLFAERILKIKNENFVIVRPFNVTGPGQNVLKGVIPKFIDRALRNEPLEVMTNGNSVPMRHFIHIDDFCRAIEKIVDNFDSYNKRTLNIGTHFGCHMEALARKIVRFAKSKSEIVLKEPENVEDHIIWNRKPDLSADSSLKDFKPKKCLVDIIKDTIEYVKSLQV